MAFDGIMVAGLVSELRQTILQGRISKIAQPESDELLLTIKTSDGVRRLALSASASLPYIYLTVTNRTSPMTAPNFCMVLRKHIANGRIVDITQPGLERVIRIQVEHLDELGDLRRKHLIIELMGKYSNIIFCDDKDRIIDSIKHISAQVSSIREVLPGRAYFIPETRQKTSPLDADEASFFASVTSHPAGCGKAIFDSYTGISSQMAAEICCRASIDPDLPVSALNQDELLHLYHNFSWIMEDIKKEDFHPVMILRGNVPVDFSAIPLHQYGTGTAEAVSPDGYTAVSYTSVSAVLEEFYAKRSAYTRIRQKSADLRKIVSNLLDRSRKKLDLQEKQLKDTGKMDKYRIYGELLNTYGYQVEEGASSVTVLNYYDNQELTIPLDGTCTPLENAQKYFARYNKLKRTRDALQEQLLSTRQELDHLSSIDTALHIAESENDLMEIRAELEQSGYLKRKYTGKKQQAVKSRPLHYLSSDGFHIYVGKNNTQNDELTFKFADGGDWWFHAKGMPGSHVVVKTQGQELPDRVFEEAAQLAGYYSNGRENDKVEIDYLQRKNVKKPNGAVPGFVVYYTNYSMAVHPDISHLKKISDD
ncbi:MAG: NFACT family protein [Lachnospiraceae bacterium]|nr:NFACT family protein [Lachnospiraceae bacterium]